jgi:hypothetical protein
MINLLFLSLKIIMISVIIHDITRKYVLDDFSEKYLTVKLLQDDCPEKELSINLSDIVTSQNIECIFEMLPDPLCYTVPTIIDKIQDDKILICDIVRVLEYLNYKPEFMNEFCSIQYQHEKIKSNSEVYKMFIWSYLGNFDLFKYDQARLSDFDICLPGIHKYAKKYGELYYIPIKSDLPNTCILPSWKSRYSLNDEYKGFVYQSNGFSLNFKDFDKKLERLTSPWLTDFPWNEFKSVCLSGGTMLSSISNLDEDPYQDIDLFVGGDDPEHTKQVAKNLLYYFKNKFEKVIYSIKSSVITMYLVGCSKPLQIIVTEDYRDLNPKRVLMRFDISCVKMYKDYTGEYIDVRTYFELMRGFMEIYQPLTPSRLRKYMKKGLSVVSRSPFVLTDQNKEYLLDDEVVNVDKIISCRNLNLEESINWYPTEINIGLISRVIKNKINRVHEEVEPIVNLLNTTDLKVLGGYKGTQYHLGFLDSLSSSRVTDIPFEISSYEPKNIITRYGVVKYDEICINPIMFWIEGKFIKYYEADTNKYTLHITFPRKLANEISTHVNNKLIQSIHEHYVGRYTDNISIFGDDRSNDQVSWVNIKVDRKDNKKLENMNHSDRLSVAVTWHCIIGIFQRNELVMKPKLVDIKKL